MEMISNKLRQTSPALKHKNNWNNRLINPIPLGDTDEK